MIKYFKNSRHPSSTGKVGSFYLWASVVLAIYIAVSAVTRTEAGVDQSSGANPIFYDRFEYVVSRDDPKAIQIFKSFGGWTGGKSEQSGARGASGYLFTTDRIPGYTGNFPGKDSKRVLALEALPATFNSQTDFYLEYGGASNETIPGNVWFQFWMYVNDYDDPADVEDQMTTFGHYFKFIYPCRTSYPCRTENQTWLFGMGAESFMPYHQLLGSPSQDVYLNVRESDDVQFPGVRDTGNTIGQKNLSERIVHNRWTLVKVHLDTSTGSGRFESWLKPLGGKWTKVVDWADGQDGLSWTVTSPGGHRVFRMPTTVGRATRRDLYNFWIYLDDFTMTKLEEHLPEYR